MQTTDASWEESAPVLIDSISPHVMHTLFMAEKKKSLKIELSVECKRRTHTRASSIMMMNTPVLKIASYGEEPKFEAFLSTTEVVIKLDGVKAPIDMFTSIGSDGHAWAFVSTPSKTCYVTMMIEV